MKLRPARRDDCAALAALWHAGWQEGHRDIVPDGLIAYRDKASFEVRIRQSLDICYVAEIDGRLAGFVRLKGAELDQFYVAADLIGQGVASPLMRAAEALMQGNGIARAYLIAAAGNDRAVRFYERQGWENMGATTAAVETSDGPFDMVVVRLEKTLN